MKLEKHEVEKYFENAPAGQKELLGKLRRIIKDTMPGSEEYISYQVPVYVLKGKRIISLGYAKDHLSLYLMNFELAQKFAEKLGSKAAGTTLHFPNDKDLPEEIITEIIKARIKDVIGKGGE